MDIELSDHLYKCFRDLLLRQSGLYYPERKRGDLAHGLSLVLKNSQFRSLGELYADALAGGPGWAAILAQLTIGETYFFRHHAQFDVLGQHILPDIFSRRTLLRTLRIWSAGCATGEEAYSIAILLNEIKPKDELWNISILATDINPQFLARAREALYGNWSFREISDDLRARYWTAEESRWRLRADIRRMVTFAPLNLIEPCYPSIANGTSSMDIITCRNVTIYFDEETTRQVIDRFYQALMPGGWLIVGHSEPHPTIYQLFEVHNFPNTILYRKPLDAALHGNDAAKRPRTGTRPLPKGTVLPDASTPAAPREPRRATGLLSRPAPPLEREQGAGMAQQIDLWIRVQSALAQKDKRAAEDLLKQLLRDDPTHTQALLTLGRLYADRGDWARARQQCMLVLEQQPLCVAAHYLLGLICEHQSQFDAALAAYRRTLYLDPSFVLGMLGMANTWRQMDRIENARRYYRNAIKQLRELPPTQAIPETDNATVAELLALVNSQLEAIANS